MGLSGVLDRSEVTAGSREERGCQSLSPACRRSIDVGDYGSRAVTGDYLESGEGSSMFVPDVAHAAVGALVAGDVAGWFLAALGADAGTSSTADCNMARLLEQRLAF